MTTSTRGRDRFRALAAGTMDIVRSGHYDVGGRRVDIAEQVAAAVTGTRLILPDARLPNGVTWTGPTTVEVRNESSLEAARRLGPGTACLVFASARNPGGGFLNGAQAQEEASRAARRCTRPRRSYPSSTRTIGVDHRPGDFGECPVPTAQVRVASPS